MNLVQRVEHWGDTHHPQWLDIVRILLGVFLCYKGVDFLMNMGSMLSLITSKNVFWIFYLHADEQLHRLRSYPGRDLADPWGIDAFRVPDPDTHFAGSYYVCQYIAVQTLFCRAHAHRSIAAAHPFPGRRKWKWEVRFFEVIPTSAQGICHTTQLSFPDGRLETSYTRRLPSSPCHFDCHSDRQRSVHWYLKLSEDRNDKLFHNRPAPAPSLPLAWIKNAAIEIKKGIFSH